MVLPGLVPEIESREACLFNGYKWREWLALERLDRAAGIAHYRTHRLIEMHGEDAVSRETEERAKRNGS